MIGVHTRDVHCTGRGANVLLTFWERQVHHTVHVRSHALLVPIVG